MTSLYSNAELFYSMPAVGPTKTTTTISIVTQTSDPCVIPSLLSLWSLVNLPGKSLHIEAGGTYDVSTGTNLLNLGFNTTEGTFNVGASSGAITVPANTTGVWGLDVNAVCTGVTSISATSWMMDGVCWYGGSASTTASSQFIVGGANTAGIPTAVTLVPTTQYFVELSSTFSSAPTAFVCSKFKVYTEN